MTLVWERFPRGGTEMMAMLCMADWCNDLGLSLYPSNEQVAAKCRVSVRQAQRVVSELVDEGWLEVIGNAFGGKPGATKQYRLAVERLIGSRPVWENRRRTERGDMDVTGDTDVTGDIYGKNGGGGVTFSAKRGDTHVTLTTIEPPLETKPPVSLSGPQAGTDDAKPNGNRLKASQVWAVLQYLNLQSGRSYTLRQPDGRGLTSGARLIADRLRQGYTVDQCKAVIAEKSNQWMGDDKMALFMRPKTLFARSNFEQYLAEATAEVRP